MRLFILFLVLFMVSALSAQTTQWRLVWDANVESDMDLYEVYRSTAPNADVLIGTNTHPDTVYVDSDLERGVQYYYRLKAVNDGGLKSDFSEEVSAAIPDVLDIPNQIIRTGANFQTFSLSLFVNDPDALPGELVWVSSPTTNIIVDVVGTDVTITYPPGWSGNESVTFSVEDKDGFNDNDVAVFTVLPPLVSPTDLRFEKID